MTEMSIAVAIDRFEATLSIRRPHTAATYTSGLNVFREWVGLVLDIDHQSPSVLDYSHFDDYLAWLIDRHGRDRMASVFTYFAALSAFLRFCARRRLLDPQVNPAVAIGEARRMVGKTPYLMREIDPRIPDLVLHVRKLPIPDPTVRVGFGGGRGGPRRSHTSALVVLRDKALIETLFCTGLRVSEVANLPRDLLERRVLLIVGKGGKQRRVFLDDDARTAIRAYLAERTDDSPYLFLNFDRARGQQIDGQQLSTQAIWLRVKAHAKAVGIADIHPHDFRHAKARALLDNGCPIDVIQDLLGHTSPDTTKRIYAGYTTKRLELAFAQYSQSANELAAAMQTTGVVS